MYDNYIHIKLKDGKVGVNFQSNLPVDDFLALMSTAILSALRQTVAALPKEEQPSATEQLFDMYNAAASNTLHLFAPEIDMRPNLTEQAILEAENNILIRQAEEESKCPENPTEESLS